MYKINRYQQRKAQSTLEYAMVIACVVGALIAMQIYIKRGIQGKLRDAADEIGEQYSAKTTTSSLTQTITNPTPTTVTGIPKFVQDPTTPGRRLEIIETTRHEATQVGVERGNFEETGRLSDESLF